MIIFEMEKEEGEYMYICKIEIFEMRNKNEAALCQREREMETKVQSFKVFTTRQRDVAFAIYLGRMQLKGNVLCRCKYFVQMRPFLLCLVLCGRSSSTNVAGS